MLRLPIPHASTTFLSSLFSRLARRPRSPLLSNPQLKFFYLTIQIASEGTAALQNVPNPLIS